MDIVQDPSAPSAFVDGIMEGVEYFFEGNEIVSRAAEEAKAEMDKLTAAKLTSLQESLFTDFLKKIS